MWELIVEYVGHSKSNEIVFAKMHNIWIQIFQLQFKFSSASFKTNITFCYLALKFWFVFPKSISEMYTPSIGVGQCLAFYFIYENKPAESNI